MQTMRSGRLLSGGTDIELVLFESAVENALDNGVPTALVSHLISQCSPVCTSLVSSPEGISDYVAVANFSSKIVVSKGEGGRSLWERIQPAISETGTYLFVIDAIHSLVSAISLSGLVRLLDSAREEIPSLSASRIVFASMLYCIDFSAAQVHAIKSLSTSIVQVSQRGSVDFKKENADPHFEVWDQVILRVGRRKPSGRVNIDVVMASFDSSTCLLTDATVQSMEDKAIIDEGHDAFEKKLNLPFKISLSESEKSSRSAVALPYRHRNAAIADAGLELHPRVLQIHNNAETGDASEDSNMSDENDDEEDLFSEDV